VLWRLEPDAASSLTATVLVQSSLSADWEILRSLGCLRQADRPLDIGVWLASGQLRAGNRLRFRLRANPCVTRNGKRLGLMQQDDQAQWLVRQAERAGFSLPMLSAQAPDICVSQQQMLRGRQRSGNGIRVWSVLFDGILNVTDPNALMLACRNGIGHGKAMGLGLLSLAPAHG
jgi:CRISPR system Cascade subunit CasE